MKNRYKTRHQGHYDPWLTESINILCQKYGMNTLDPRFNGGYTNGRLRLTSGQESFGITAIPEEISRSLNMHHIPQQLPDTTVTTSMLISISIRLSIPTGIMNNPRGALYNYLATKQHVKKAVLPLHTQLEFKLFSKKLRCIHNHNQSSINWNELACEWNNIVNTGMAPYTLFYKSPEHLESFYNSCWKKRNVAYNSIMNSNGVCETMEYQLQSPDRSYEVVSAQYPAPLRINASINPQDGIPVSPAAISSSLQSSSSSLSSSLNPTAENTSILSQTIVPQSLYINNC